MEDIQFKMVQNAENPLIGQMFGMFFFIDD